VDVGAKQNGSGGTFSSLADLIAGGRSGVTSCWSGREGEISAPQKRVGMLMD